MPRIQITESDPDGLAALLGALVTVNLGHMEKRGGAPSLFRSGVRYRREALGSETWQNYLQVLRAGYGDCEDLVGWRVAELIFNGLPAAPALKRTSFGYHAVVVTPYGIEDPSRRLGMRP